MSSNVPTSKLGRVSTATVKARSPLASIAFSTSAWLPARSTFGSSARRSLLSSTILRLASLTAFCTTSPISERPYRRLRCAAGTFPGRNPLMRTFAFISLSSASSLEARSAAGSTTLYSRLRPSALISVTCIVVAFQTVESTSPLHVGSDFMPGSSSNPYQDTLPAGGAGGGTRTPTIAHRNLNPARLPIPPRPRAVAGPLSGLGFIATTWTGCSKNFGNCRAAHIDRAREAGPTRA